MSSTVFQVLTSPDPLPADLPTTPREALERACRLWGEDHVVYDFPEAGETMDLAGLRAAAEAWAGVLHGLGVGPGDRVAICLPGHPLWPVLQNACSIVGASYVGVNVKYRGWEIRRLLDAVRPTVLVAGRDATSETCVDTLVELASEASVRTVWVGPGAPDGTTPADSLVSAAAPVPCAEAVARAGDVALIQFTSGSTGAPKAVAHTHAQVQLTARNISAMAGYDESDVVFSALPFYHVGGSMCTGPIAVVSGARVVIPRRFSATGSVRTMIDRQCTATQGHAAMFTMQIEIVARDGLRDRLALRKGWTASPPAVIRQIHDVLGIESIIPAYGMSECGMTIGGRVDDPLEKRINTVGRPTPGALVRIADVGLDGVGELQLGGPPVIAEYLDDPDATAASFTEDGFLRTGDLVRVDEDGYLVFADRLKDMIKPGGENVSTTEVEAFLMSLPHVVGASVVGAPDPVLGEVPVAFVQVDASVDPDRIIDACRAGIASFKVPRWVELVADFPVMATGKVDKPALRARARERSPVKERRA
ncbi:class I adenylate-forming enzyme family protein [Nocardioides sp. LHD-245]|uniref:class I adenylate-forming enzyme family protein n=1 Tax=Nocardioides sp. LHD-245 TaxID=3051387 RepID=UPI0027E1A2D1|nr:class I adenylate-forming enzyme family protein [Nocardioides sp. LHD-245]